MKQNGSQYYGYWRNENDIQNFLRVELNGSVLVSSVLFLEMGPLALSKGEMGLEINTDTTRID